MSKSKKTNVPDDDNVAAVVNTHVHATPVIKNHYNGRYFPKTHEINTQPSKTVPNQAMTVKELIIRFASGLPLTGAKIPIYEGSEEFPDINRMDLIERELYYLDLKKQREEVEERVKGRRVKAEQMKMEKVISERVAKKQQEDDRKAFEEFKKSNRNNPS